MGVSFLLMAIRRGTTFGGRRLGRGSAHITFYLALDATAVTGIDVDVGYKAS
jgi:hypothetical protein